MSPAKGLQDGVASVEIVVPDSVKQALAAQFSATLLTAPVAISANLLVPAVATLSNSLSSCGSGDAFAGYSESKVPFAPEGAPNIAPYPVYDDGYLEHVPLGFSFSFHGNTHSEVNVYSNGLIMFGPAVKSPTGFYRGDLIPFSASPNNIIAFAWTDWSPQLVAGGIRYETRGTAPNRRFILQFTNVPEYSGNKTAKGLLMSQVVLAEGSNDITIYTNTMTITNSSQRVTQGIENALGTEALYDSVQNAVLGTWSPRVRGFFNLSNDAVRFSLISVKDKEIPTITAPDNVTQGNDPGLASALVAVGSPVAADNCLEVTVSGVRSDGAALDAPYPVGVTTITWTAKDAAGNTASATQTVTVLDVEAPVFPVTRVQPNLTVNATSPAGAAVTYRVDATDNVGVTSLLCTPASGSVFPVGLSEVSCTARDAAGNSSSKSFPVIVVSAHDQIDDLLTLVRSLNLPNGTAQPLINQLLSAYREQGNECKKMSDFIELVAKKLANTKNIGAAESITDSAYTVMGALGCGQNTVPTRSLTRILY